MRSVTTRPRPAQRECNGRPAAIGRNDAPAGRWLSRALAVLLVLAFVSGGSAQDHVPGDVLARLFALPVLVMGVLVLATRSKAPLLWFAIVTATAVALLPALQMLPMPQALWSWPSGRASLLRDLHAAGVVPRFTWTLTPSATERAFWSQLPALASFLGALALDGVARRRLAGLVLGLLTGGAALGLVQMVAGQDSLLNPFPQWIPAAGGVFANQNHQASALLIGALLGLAVVLEVDGGRDPSCDARRRRRTGAGCLALCLLVLPITGSRAGLLLTGPALVSLMWASGFFGRLRARAPALSRVVAYAAALAVAACTALAWYLLRSTADREARWPIARATAALAREAWPLGTGVGSFPVWFEQAGPDALLGLEYINHAHNEYVQWWLEGGIAALVLVALSLVALAVVATKLVKRIASPTSHAAWIGVAVLLAGSIVDYPLRTPALMTIGAFLAGLAVASAARVPGGRAAR